MGTTTIANRSFPFNTHFCLLTFGLLIVWILVIVTAAPPATDGDVDRELKNSQNCKNLCRQCGCMGFYCGEECICECNKENSHTECIGEMQTAARKLNIPFELLIQGPTANHFVRNALNFEQNAERRKMAQILANAYGRNKRSTVVIYKPNIRNSLHNERYEKKSIIKKDSAGGSGGVSIRHKRSVKNFDWFNDFANVLVRPAPLNRFRPDVANTESAESQQQQPMKRSNDEIDRSWFADNSNSLVRPAPFNNKRNQQQQQQQETMGDDVGDRREEVYNTALAAVEKIPGVIKDTIRTIKETTMNDEFGGSLRSKIKEGAEVFNDNLQSGNLELLPENFGENFGELLSNMQANLFPNSDVDFALPSSSSSQTGAGQQKLLFPLFRPIRFLQRVQEAINDNREKN